MKPKISIIIPVFNTQKYLTECLDSCINQTLKDIEIICVDDCSTDNSMQILLDFEKKDDRVKIIKHKKNLRQGGARNTGIRYATGEYIWFIDSDDFISKESCQLVYDIAKKNNVDILRFNAVSFIDDGVTYTYTEDSYYTDWKKNENINVLQQSNTLSIDFQVSPVCYIAKRTYIANFLFRENCFYEDTDYTLKVFSLCPSMRCICYTAYHRRYARDSVTQSSLTKEQLIYFIQVVYSLRNFIKEHKIEKKHFLYRFYNSYFDWVASEILKNKNLFSTNDKCIQDYLVEFELKNKKKNSILKKCFRFIFSLPVRVRNRIFKNRGK